MTKEPGCSQGQGSSGCLAPGCQPNIFNIKLLVSLFVSFNQEALVSKCLMDKKNKNKHATHARFQEQWRSFHYGLLLFVSLYAIFHRLFSTDGEKIRPWSRAPLWAFNSWRNSNHLALSSRAPAGFLLTDFRLLMWCHCADPCFLQQPYPPLAQWGLGAGHKPVINRRSPGAIWGKMGTFLSRMKTSGATC